MSANRLINVNPLLFVADPPDLPRIQQDLDPSVTDPLDATEGTIPV